VAQSQRNVPLKRTQLGTGVTSIGSTVHLQEPWSPWDPPEPGPLLHPCHTCPNPHTWPFPSLPCLLPSLIQQVSLASRREEKVTTEPQSFSRWDWKAQRRSSSCCGSFIFSVFYRERGWEGTSIPLAALCQAAPGTPPCHAVFL
jgi:hypothetical protein